MLMLKLKTPGKKLDNQQVLTLKKLSHYFTVGVLSIIRIFFQKLEELFSPPATSSTLAYSAAVATVATSAPRSRQAFLAVPLRWTALGIR